MIRTPLARTGILKPGAKPLKRSGFKPKAPTAGAGLLRVDAVQREARTRKPMKSSRPKMTPIRRAARGQECTLQILGVCNGESDTVVLCHSNSLADGKGMGLKAPDTAACFGCSACHDVLDGRRPRPAGMTAADVDTYFRYAIQKTHAILREKGLIA